MRIAVTYEDGNVYQHFGHTSQMKIYDVEDGKVVHEEVVDTAGNGHGALAGFRTESRYAHLRRNWRRRPDGSR